MEIVLKQSKEMTMHLEKDLNMEKSERLMTKEVLEVIISQGKKIANIFNFSQANKKKTSEKEYPTKVRLADC